MGLGAKRTIITIIKGRSKALSHLHIFTLKRSIDRYISLLFFIPPLRRSSFIRHFAKGHWKPLKIQL